MCIKDSAQHLSNKPSFHFHLTTQHIAFEHTNTCESIHTTNKPFREVTNMPLVIPGITGNSGDKTEEWTNKLVGKKLSEGSSDEVVRITCYSSAYNDYLHE